jgi:hypothetical protein
MRSRKPKSAKRRVQRRLQVELENQKLFINNRPVLRTLKPSARKRLVKECAPRLWILPENHIINTKQGGPYPHASLLGLPAELRQTILLLSHDINAMVVRTLHGIAREEREGGNVPKALREQITQLCQVSRVLRTDMQYVGMAWRQQTENLLSSNITISRAKALIPLPHGLTYVPHRRSGEAVKGGEKRSHKKRSAKCWYCNERHTRDGTGCPRATKNPRGWMEDTRAVGGWRGKKQTKDSFTGTKIVFSE